MAEFIEREPLLRYLNGIWLSAAPTDTMFDDDRQLAVIRCIGLNDAMDAVREAPAADVRPVVFCKDCIHRHDRNRQGCQGRRPDFFCAAGEKREES